MHGQPMIGDFSAGADPDTLTLAYMIEEADQARSAAGPADQPIMQAHAHQPGADGALLV